MSSIDPKSLNYVAPVIPMAMTFFGFVYLAVAIIMASGNGH